MDLRRAGIAALFLLGSAASATAQSATPATTAGVGAASAPGTASASIDVGRLGLNVNRIHKQLRQTKIAEEINGLNLRYSIDVYGQSPRIEILTGNENLKLGPVPYGAPTHNDMLQVMTPQEYRAPVADFG